MRFSLNAFNGSAFFGAGENLVEWIDAAAGAGFEAWAPDAFSLSDYRAKGGKVEALAKRANAAGIVCEAIAAGGMMDGTTAPLDLLRATRDDAIALGAHYIQVNGGAPNPAARMHAFEEAVQLLDGTDLRLAIEFMPISPLNSLKETIEIAGNLGFDHAGAMVDLWHLQHDADGWAQLATMPLDALAYVEICDALPPDGNDLAEETLHRRTLPSEGVLECERFVQLLTRRGYDGLVSVEVLNRSWRAKPTDIFAKRCLENSRALFERQDLT